MLYTGIWYSIQRQDCAYIQPAFSAYIGLNNLQEFHLHSTLKERKIVVEKNINIYIYIYCTLYLCMISAFEGYRKT
jgi:hypothetical protein